jgi:alkylation response protein AidB-like acyl-CoA dehydrogenase
MSNFASSPLPRNELTFLLFDWLRVDDLPERSRYAEHSRSTFEAALDTAERIATTHFAPHYRKADQHEPTFEGEHVYLIPEIGQAIAAFREAGFLAASQDAEFGGFQLPYTVERACMAYFLAANVATAGYPFLAMANANTLIAHASRDLIDRFARPLLEGRFLGTMCLSEPDAGSSLADVRTRAEPRSDGTFRLFGTKTFISAGEHDLSETIVHLVLARTSGACAGTRGLSLFVVPKHCVDVHGTVGERNDVIVVGLNHKMGFRATINCVMSFGEGRYSPGGEVGAVGHLVGEEGNGLAHMFHMMNEARIGVGLGAAMLGWMGYLQSVAYARSRLQGRLPGTADPNSAPVPIIRHADVRRMLLAQRSYVDAALALCLYCARLVDEQRTAATLDERHRANMLLDLLTPVAKAWPSQWCLAANDLAIQVHGGYGYTRDFAVEQLYRDNRLNPIHEGTQGIQALDLLGRKVRAEGGAAFDQLRGIIAETCRRAHSSDDKETVGFAADLTVAWTRLAEITVALHKVVPPEKALANASVYLETFGHAVIAWVWLDQLMSLPSNATAISTVKRAACRFFYRWELPRIHPQLDLLLALDTTVLDVPHDCF